MFVTLIKPPAYSSGIMGAQLVPYLGIAYIAAVLRDSGHSVMVIDACAEEIDKAEVLHGKYVSYGMPLSELPKRLTPCDVVVITCTFSQDWVFHREIIKTIKETLPKSIIVAGGEHISSLPEFCLQDCLHLDVCDWRRRGCDYRIA